VSIRSLWPGAIRLVRPAMPTDSTISATNVRVEWADSTPSVLWRARARPDTVGAVRAGDAVLIAPFVRRWMRAASSDRQTRVSARWIDGEPAAVERVTEAGCIRSIAFSMPAVGDAVLRPSFARFLTSLRAPCAARSHAEPMSLDVLAALAGPAGLAPTSAIRRPTYHVSRATPWLLAAALVLAVLELVVRATTPAPVPPA
jgi:hypothetical protein